MLTEAQATKEQFEFVQKLKGARSHVFDTLSGTGENGRLVRRFMMDRETFGTTSYWSDEGLDDPNNAEQLLDDYLAWYYGDPEQQTRAAHYQPPPRPTNEHYPPQAVIEMTSMYNLHLQSNDERVWAGQTERGGYNQ
jgi:hypothetical protein